MSAGSTAPGERFYQRGLTGIRALAAFWVMMFHLNGMVGPRVIALDLGFTQVELHPLITVGWVGVNVFFVLSGFLLTTHLLEALSRQPAREVYPRYFVARIRRVFPAYWAQLALLLAVSLAVQRSLPEWAVHVPLHVPMLHHLSATASWAINPVFWTLPIEFTFYLCLPVLANALVRREHASPRERWRFLAMAYLFALATALAYRYLVFHLYAPIPGSNLAWASNQLPGTLDQFVLGSLAAAVLRWHPAIHAANERSRGRLSDVLALLGLAGIVAMIYAVDAVFDIFWQGHWLLYGWYSITAIFIALLVVATGLSGRLTRWAFENPVSVFLGIVSYSIYLWHHPIGLALASLMDARAAGLWLFCLVAIPAIVAVSALSYVLVERPFLHRRSTRPGAPVLADPGRA